MSCIGGVEGNQPSKRRHPRRFYLTYLNEHRFASTAEWQGRPTAYQRPGLLSAGAPVVLVKPWPWRRAAVSALCFGLAPYFRLSYATSEQNLREAVMRIAKACRELS